MNEYNIIYTCAHIRNTIVQTKSVLKRKYKLLLYLHTIFFLEVENITNISCLIHCNMAFVIIVSKKKCLICDKNTHTL